MKVAILQCVLGGFDEPQDPVEQDTDHTVDFHRFTDEDFPPITGLTPRLQYRIPKTHGFEMFPGYDLYIWLDGGVSLQRPDCVEWYVDQLGENDAAFFRHPSRRNVRQEVKHIEDKLADNHWYITPRYKGGLHREMLDLMEREGCPDRDLYASTAFIYRNTPSVQAMLKDWWYYASRYFSCDQVNLPYVLWKHKLDVKKIDANLFKIGYLSLVSHHK